MSAPNNGKWRRNYGRCRHRGKSFCHAEGKEQQVEILPSAVYAVDKTMGREHKERSQSEEYAHLGCSGGDSGQRGVQPHRQQTRRTRNKIYEAGDRLDVEAVVANWKIPRYISTCLATDFLCVLVIIFSVTRL